MFVIREDADLSILTKHGWEHSQGNTYYKYLKNVGDEFCTELIINGVYDRDYPNKLVVNTFAEDIEFAELSFDVNILLIELAMLKELGLLEGDIV